jgi:outer membrane protein TolC
MRASQGALFFLLLLRGPAYAQQAPVSIPEVFLGGVADKAGTGNVLDLSLAEAIARGRAHNLGLLLAEQNVAGAEGTRWKALADLLPNVGAQGTFTREKLNLAVFGISIPGFPTLVGPFNVYDARAAVRQNLFDLKDLHTLRSEGQNLDAARSNRKDAEGLVVLVCGALYLQAISAESRIEQARAQRDTAKALFELARDRKNAGSVPGVDVLRAQVELSSREQQVIVAENTLAKAKLSLGRAIGLAPGQEIHLTDQVPYAEIPDVTVDAALSKAYADRADWKAQLARVRAAEESRDASKSQYLPTLDLEADIGKIGQTLDTLKVTYTLVGTLRVPIFEGGRTRGKVLEADARLNSQRDALEDLRARIDLEVRSAMLDVKAASQRVHVAREAGELAKEQLKQAKDRFAAGVSGNLDVVQAQESVATAAENEIASLYDFNLARATLARAVGAAESAYGAVVKGE